MPGSQRSVPSCGCQILQEGSLQRLGALEHHRNICSLNDFPSGHSILPYTRSYNSLINSFSLLNCVETLSTLKGKRPSSVCLHT